MHFLKNIILSIIFIWRVINIFSYVLCYAFKLVLGCVYAGLDLGEKYREVITYTSKATGYIFQKPKRKKTYTQAPLEEQPLERGSEPEKELEHINSINPKKLEPYNYTTTLLYFDY